MALRPTRKFAALLAGGSITLGTFLFPPAAHGDDDWTAYNCEFLPGKNFWHLQNYTRSGKTVTLFGYVGNDTKGDAVTVCRFHLRRSRAFGPSFGGEAYLNPEKIKTVHVKTESDHGGTPVETTLPNNQNTCFRITYPDNSDNKGWVLNRHYQCNPPPAAAPRRVPRTSD